MVLANGPMTALGLTDPRDWRGSEWAADVLPHLAYGVITAATYSVTDVPKGGSRLRITLSCHHTDEEVAGLVDALTRAKKREGEAPAESSSR